MDKDELQKKYNQFARWYDFGEALPELLTVKKLRRELLHRASGRVLEVAVGTGKNLRYYPRACHITAIDLSPGMLEIARKRAVRLGLNVDFSSETPKPLLSQIRALRASATRVGRTLRPPWGRGSRGGRLILLGGRLRGQLRARVLEQAASEGSAELTPGLNLC